MIFSKRHLLNIVIPLIINQVLSVAIGMEDSIMVSSAGAAAIAGMGRILHSSERTSSRESARLACMGVSSCIVKISKNFHKNGECPGRSFPGTAADMGVSTYL